MGLITFTVPTMTPVLLTATVEPVTKFVPVSVTGTVVPRNPLPGASDVSVGAAGFTVNANAEILLIRGRYEDVACLILGVLVNEASSAFESFQDTGHGEGLPDCPHWTRPADIRGWKAPGVLLGGNYEEIRKFRQNSPPKKPSASGRIC